MTRKDYQLIAEVVRGSAATPSFRRPLAMRFATTLAQQNGRFDLQRFMEACGCTGDYEWADMTHTRIRMRS